MEKELKRYRKLNEGESSSNSSKDKSYLDSTNVLPSTRLGNENVYLFSSPIFKWFYDDNRVFLSISQTLDLLTLAILKRFYDGGESISTDKWNIRSFNSNYAKSILSAYKSRTYIFFY
ncbi:hypothetical protein HZH68_016216 [Vespula germanica]|uniref:Uncharacterized protein n=1 Tax=Vespula germanica TaxID=30212 RepID=A0A834J3B3_VESGE|nr:hypothetical protein HZH68_016216 [Vespula germanica]